MSSLNFEKGWEKNLLLKFLWELLGDECRGGGISCTRSGVCVERYR